MLTTTRLTPDTSALPRKQTPRRSSRWAAAVGLLYVACAVNAWAQSATPPARSGLNSQAPAPASPNQRKAESRPTWKELSAGQQLALKPLALSWAGLSAERKRKWIELSKNYAVMSANEQAKLHGRMTEWVSLSQQQRTQARLNYVQTQRLGSEEKDTQWQAYQALSAEEKRQLRSQAASKPRGVATVKPSAGDKIIHVPITRHTSKKEEDAAALAIHRSTLLPKPSASTPAAETAPSAIAPAQTDETAPAGATVSEKSPDISGRPSSAPTQNQ